VPGYISFLTSAIDEMDTIHQHLIAGHNLSAAVALIHSKILSGNIKSTTFLQGSSRKNLIQQMPFLSLLPFFPFFLTPIS